jgi:acid phosphatase
MHRSLRLAPLAAALATAFAAAAAAPAHAATTNGVVVGHGVYQHAKVCIDTNGNARCDANEAAAWTDAAGRFSLPGKGALVAEVGTDATLFDPATATSTPVSRPLVLRAASGAGVVVGPLSTEVQSAVDAGKKPGVARNHVAERVGVTAAKIVEDPNGETDPAVRALLFTESDGLLDRIANAVAEAGASGNRVVALGNRLDLDAITNVVVIFAENRSFNNVFNDFPGANGVRHAKAGTFASQKDRDGSEFTLLPPAWNGLTAAGQAVQVTQAMTTNVWANAPFQIDSANPAWGAPAIDQTIVTRDLYHRFYENQMQIDGGANDRFVAWADSGGLAMGWYDGSKTAMWNVAQEYVLADNFFQGAFGGSYLNHQYLVCACVPEYPNADTSPAHPTIAVLDKDANGNFTPNLTTSATSPASAMSGPPGFVLSGNLTPRNYFGDDTFRTVNTMQPPYQPSGNAPAGTDTDGLYADPMIGTTLPAQTQTNIGDLLTSRNLSWKWYSGGWNAAVANRGTVYNPGAGNFQAHHQPFNYFAEFDPLADAQARAAHLQDYDNLVADAAAGTLPAVSFYKPIGVNNEHPGYASLAQGDAHIAGVIQALKASPQWKHMLVIVTYDENGGQWDEVAPPKGDLVGPGTRIPAVFVSPFVKKHVVDHTQYDTASILRFITHRFSLPVLDGLAQRDAALAANGAATMGDFTNVLEFRHRDAKQ